MQPVSIKKLTPHDIPPGQYFTFPTLLARLEEEIAKLYSKVESLESVFLGLRHCGPFKALLTPKELTSIGMEAALLK
jgi:hypothetical protein